MGSDEQWEYKVLDLSYLTMDKMVAILNEHGAHRWELVAVVRREVFMKRNLSGVKSR
jgi:hypothetical protein